MTKNWKNYFYSIYTKSAHRVECVILVYKKYRGHRAFLDILTNKVLLFIEKLLK